MKEKVSESRARRVELGNGNKRDEITKVLVCCLEVCSPEKS
jgi:hypothetical protein